MTISPFGSHSFTTPSVTRNSPLRRESQLGSVTCTATPASAASGYKDKEEGSPSHLALMRMLKLRSRDGEIGEREGAGAGWEAL